MQKRGKIAASTYTAPVKEGKGAMASYFLSIVPPPHCTWILNHTSLATLKISEMRIRKEYLKEKILAKFYIQCLLQVD